MGYPVEIDEGSNFNVFQGDLHPHLSKHTGNMSPESIHKKVRPLTSKALIAMIGLKPLPGSPGYDGSEQAIIERALADLELYAAAGADAILIENSGDLPYIKPPLDDRALGLVADLAAMIRSRYAGPIGLQLLEAANLEALEVAHSAGLDFLRVEGYVFAHIGGAGLIEGCAGKLLRRRRQLGADCLSVFADVRKKHCSHAITGDLALAEHVRQAEFFKTDGLVITGPRTGARPEICDLQEAAAASPLPKLIGSGMNRDNIASFYPHADGFIIGSTFRKEGEFLGELDPDRLESFMDVFRRLKSDECHG